LAGLKLVSELTLCFFEKRTMLKYEKAEMSFRCSTVSKTAAFRLKVPKHRPLVLLIRIMKKMDVHNWNRGKAEVLEEKPVPVPRTDAFEDSVCSS
jgi:hypothetical protein